MTDGEFAERLGVRQSTVWRWVHGKRIPTIAWALRIRDETSGAVPIEGWAKATLTGAREPEGA